MREGLASTVGTTAPGGLALDTPTWDHAAGAAHERQVGGAAGSGRDGHGRRDGFVLRRGQGWGLVRRAEVAGAEVLVAQVDERRDLRGADVRIAQLRPERAARMEPAARRRIDRARARRRVRMTRWRRASGIGDRDGRHQRQRVRVLLLAEQVVPVGELGDPPRYMTATRSLMCSTTPMLWATNT